MNVTTSYPFISEPTDTITFTTVTTLGVPCISIIIIWKWPLSIGRCFNTLLLKGDHKCKNKQKITKWTTSTFIKAEETVFSLKGSNLGVLLQQALHFKTFSNAFWPKSGGQTGQKGNITIYCFCDKDTLIPLFLSLAHEYTIFVLDV